ncbi:MAG TPA: protein phosphatase CheZ [Rhodopila sp.]|jgi:chemotaxis protein CheZ|nr:protein phosphatase CheZ [Rhodopila sp.]
MPKAVNESKPAGITALKRALTAIRHRQPPIEPDMITEVVRATLTTISDELTANEVTLLREIEDLGRMIMSTKSDIAALRVDDITDHDIPFATDELDAIVAHTAQATEAILESCEMLDQLTGTVGDAAAAQLQAATTRIYEACGFQDITGQRISKIVTTLKTIEGKIAHIINTFGPADQVAQRVADHVAGDAELLNGPQLPANAMDQSDIDKLLASFE